MGDQTSPGSVPSASRGRSDFAQTRPWHCSWESGLRSDQALALPGGDQTSPGLDDCASHGSSDFAKIIPWLPVVTRVTCRLGGGNAPVVPDRMFFGNAASIRNCCDCREFSDSSGGPKSTNALRHTQARKYQKCAESIKSAPLKGRLVRGGRVNSGRIHRG